MKRLIIFPILTLLVAALIWWQSKSEGDETNLSKPIASNAGNKVNRSTLQIVNDELIKTYKIYSGVLTFEGLEEYVKNNSEKLTKLKLVEHSEKKCIQVKYDVLNLIDDSIPAITLDDLFDGSSPLNSESTTEKLREFVGEEFVHIDGLLELIRDNVATATWDEDDVRIGIDKYYIVINQTPDVHSAIKELLDDVSKAQVKRAEKFLKNAIAVPQSKQPKETSEGKK